jgi:hypothetical protein
MFDEQRFQEGTMVKSGHNVVTICLVIAYFLSINSANSSDDMRGHKYCEIVLAKKGFNFSIYSSAKKMNGCPEDWWNQITSSAVKKETKAYFVYLNGPSYCVSDDFEYPNAAQSERLVLNNIEMQKVGFIHLNVMDLVYAGKPYREHRVLQHSVLIYRAGRPVYELIDPNHHVYIMRSYNVKLQPQSEQTLSVLSSQLTLPKGWSFKTGTLQNDIYLTSINYQAILLQDNFLNTYQKAPHDFIA